MPRPLARTTLAITACGLLVAACSDPVLLEPQPEEPVFAEVRFGHCPAHRRPEWFAVQQADGTLEVVEPEGEAYRFVIEGTHAAFYHARTGSFTYLDGVLRTREELLEAPIELCEPEVAPAATVSATIAGLVGSESHATSFGGPTIRFSGNGTFTFPTGPEATNTLVSGKYTGAPITPALLQVRRNLSSALVDLGTIDLSDGAPGSVLPQAAPLTFNDLPGLMTADVWLHGGSACRGVELFQTSATDGHPIERRRFWGLPDAALAPDEWHRVTATGYFNAPQHLRLRAVTFWTRAVVPMDVMLPPVNVEPVIERAADVVSPRFALDVPDSYRRGAEVRYNSSDPWRYASIDVSGGWLASVGTTVMLPDFTGLAGWNPEWAPITSGEFHWSVRQVGGPGGPGCTAGVQEETILWQGNVGGT